MAFSSTITQKSVHGNEKVRRGTFQVTSSSMGGDIDTGLRVCKTINITVNSTSTALAKAAVNETLPVVGSAVTIVTDVASSTISGYWEAKGY